MEAGKVDIYTRITNQVIEAIEEGTKTYRMPWKTTGRIPTSPINAVSRRPYRGVNILLLWMLAETKGYESGLWATYGQWKKLGAQVRKGETACGIVYWNFLEVETESGDESHDGKARRIPFARQYYVFNAAQVDGFQDQEPKCRPEAAKVMAAEEFFTGLSVQRLSHGNCAFYCPVTDSVCIPPIEAFPRTLDYYSVLSHETTHWTGAPHRLARDMAARFGSARYAMEELVAELGAAFLCADLGLPSDPRTDHAPYIASWLEVLRRDKRAIVAAASKAQEAADWMKAKVENTAAVAA